MYEESRHINITIIINTISICDIPNKIRNNIRNDIFKHIIANYIQIPLSMKSNYDKFLYIYF